MKRYSIAQQRAMKFAAQWGEVDTRDVRRGTCESLVNKGMFYEARLDTIGGQKRHVYALTEWGKQYAAAHGWMEVEA